MSVACRRILTPPRSHPWASRSPSVLPVSWAAHSNFPMIMAAACRPISSACKQATSDLLMCVLPGFAGTGVGDREAAIPRGDHPQVCAILCAALRIRDQSLRAIVRRIRTLGRMKLPHVDETWAVMHGLPGLRHAGFMRAVVHDGDTRMHGIHNRP